MRLGNEPNDSERGWFKMKLWKATRRMEKRQDGHLARKRRRQKGFTLIEMLVVVLILVIVAGIGFVVVNNQIEKSRERTDIANVRTIADAVQRYMMENTDVPTVEKLVNEGYLAAPPKNPWGEDNPEHYNISKEGTNDIKVTGIKQGNEVILKGAIPSSGSGG